MLQMEEPRHRKSKEHAQDHRACEDQSWGQGGRQPGYRIYPLNHLPLPNDQGHEAYLPS